MKDEIAHRNEQFEAIAKQKAEYKTVGNPVVSIDTKKKEKIGNFYRDGRLYTAAEIRAFDHDFNSFAEGTVIPHAIYDIKLNHGFIHIGTSRDTSEFACDCIRSWWSQKGQFDYPDATSILILCDGGGSNASRSHIFKQDLQELVDEIGIEIRIAHYPPYRSKYNPVEHRLFPHVTQACQGVLFKSVEFVQRLISRTKTKQGLSVSVHLLDHIYHTKRKATQNFIDNMPILFDDFLPRWNYTAIPRTS